MQKTPASDTLRAIIFDFDGTLADSFQVTLEIFDMLTNRQQPLTSAEIAEFRNYSLGQIIKKVGIKKWQIPRLLVRGRQEISKRIDDVIVFEGIPAVLENLQTQGYEIYILSTNSKENIDKFLAKHELNQYIRDVYGNVGLTGKVASLRRLQKRAGLKSSECIYIGDETRDILAAKRAKLACISVTWGFNGHEILAKYQPDKLVDEPLELIDAIDALA